MHFNHIGGGVCAPKGFKAAGVHCGIRKNRAKRDLALIVSDVPCAAAAVYTRNKVFGAPITVTRNNIQDGMAQAVLCNSGNANTCNADGVEIAEKMCLLAAEATGLKPSDFIIASTGVIGQALDISPIASGIKAIVPLLSYDGSADAADAIMTTDLKPKEVAASFLLCGKEIRIGAISKGSGMIHPNMATMLGFITTDAAISSAMLKKALTAAVEDTFNMLSVDGDTSTNDTVSIMANGLAGNPPIEAEGADFDAFTAALKGVCVDLVKRMAADGEGATKLIECTVSGAPDVAVAKAAAKSIICSSLVKTAMFGADANWGRILCAIGYAEGDFVIDTVDVVIKSEAGSVAVCKDAAGIPFSEEEAKKVLLCPEIAIDVDMKQGNAEATAWGCDLTYDYVKINGDYRT